MFLPFFNEVFLKLKYLIFDDFLDEKLEILLKFFRKGNETANINKGNTNDEKRIAIIENKYPIMYVKIFGFTEYL